MSDYVADFNETSSIVGDYWPINTKVELCQVPWDNSYKDIVIFGKESDKNAYFENMGDSISWVTDTFSYLKPNQPIKVPIAYSSAYKYNYAVVTNEQNPVATEGAKKTYYYFVTNIQYVAPSTSLLTLQLDVIMTYCQDGDNANIGSMYVERGHVGVANKSVGNDMLTIDGAELNKYLSLPEGLDVGSDYIVGTSRTWNLDTRDAYVIIVSSASLTTDPGNETDPNLQTAEGMIVDGLPSGCVVYATRQFGNFMRAASDFPWVSQCILAIYTFPAQLLTLGDSVTLFPDTATPIPAFKITEGLKTNVTLDYNMPGAWQIYKYIFNEISQIHAVSGFDAYTYKKLMCYPYTVIELTTNDGAPVFLKPQLINGTDIEFQAMSCALYPFARIGVYPQNYGGAFTDREYTYFYYDVDGLQDTTPKIGHMGSGSFLDNAVWISDFPMFSIVNNNYALYMASTTHTRQYNYQSAGWALDRSTAAAQLSADQTSFGMAAAQANQDITNKNAMVQAGLSAVAGLTGAGIAGGGLAKTGAGGVGFGVSLLNTGLNVISDWSSAYAANEQFKNNLEVTGYNRDTNLAYASYANTGDYSNAIAGINATVQDAALTAPSTIGQAGGNGFNRSAGLVNFTVKIKTISQAAERAVLNFFQRFGYEVRQFVKVDTSTRGNFGKLMCMSNFSYWKCKEVYLTSALANETEKQTIRGIMEKGVTVWTDPNKIGTTLIADNEVSNTVEWTL